MKETNVLMTGGTGFLGSALLKKFASKSDVSVTVLKRTTSRMDRVRSLTNAPNVTFLDIEDTDLDGLFASRSFDVILHCATNYGRGNTNIIDIVNANLILPLTLLQLGIKHKVHTFVNTDTVIDKRVNYYSLSKKQFLDWLETATGKIQCVNIALEHFYGPFDDESKFTTMIFRKLMRNEPVLALTPGEQKRHFIHIDDVVSAFECVLSNLPNLGEGLSSFEVSTEKSVSIRDFVTLAKAIARNTTTQLDFGAVPYRANELMDSQTDISKLKALGWKPKTSLEDGIKHTMESEIKSEISH